MRQDNLIYYSRLLSEMQADTKRLATLGFGRKRLRRYFAGQIDHHARTLRDCLAQETKLPEGE